MLAHGASNIIYKLDVATSTHVRKRECVHWSKNRLSSAQLNSHTRFSHGRSVFFFFFFFFIISFALARLLRPLWLISIIVFFRFQFPVLGQHIQHTNIHFWWAPCTYTCMKRRTHWAFNQRLQLSIRARRRGFSYEYIVMLCMAYISAHIQSIEKYSFIRLYLYVCVCVCLYVDLAIRCDIILAHVWVYVNDNKNGLPSSSRHTRTAYAVPLFNFYKTNFYTILCILKSINSYPFRYTCVCSVRVDIFILVLWNLDTAWKGR